MNITEKDKARFWIKANQTKKCWNWTGSLNNDGYGIFRQNELILAHRMAYTIIYGDCTGIQVLHKCDNPRCVNPDHLWTGTHQDNMDDKKKKGRSRHLGRVSNFYGVSWRNDSKKWRSYIIIQKKMKFLKCHDSEIEAAKNYDKVAFLEYGITDRLNFPDDWMPLPKTPE